MAKKTYNIKIGERSFPFEDEEGLDPVDVYDRWMAQQPTSAQLRPQSTLGQVGAELLEPFRKTGAELLEGAGSVATGGALEKLLGAAQVIGAPITGFVADPGYRGLKGLTEQLMGETGSEITARTGELSAALAAPQQLATAMVKPFTATARGVGRWYEAAKRGSFPGIAKALTERFRGGMSSRMASLGLAVEDAAIYSKLRPVADRLFAKARNLIPTDAAVTSEPLITALDGLAKQPVSESMKTSTEKLIGGIKNNLAIREEGAIVGFRDITFREIDDSLQEATRLYESARLDSDRRILRAVKDAIADTGSLLNTVSPEGVRTFNAARRFYASRMGPIFDRRANVPELLSDPAKVIDAVLKLPAEKLDKRFLPKGLAPRAYQEGDVMSGLTPQGHAYIKAGVFNRWSNEGTTNGIDLVRNAIRSLDPGIEQVTAQNVKELLRSQGVRTKLSAIYRGEADDVGRILEALADVPLAQQTGFRGHTMLGAHMLARGSVGLAAGGMAAGVAGFTGAAEAAIAGAALMASPFAISTLLKVKGGARLLRTALDMPLGSPQRAALTARISALVRALEQQQE